MRISDWSSDVCSSDLGLCQQVGQQCMVMPGQGMRRTHHADEIGRHRIGALMQRLEKTVLRTAADTTPDHRPGYISKRAAIHAYRLAEALPHPLLRTAERRGGQGYVETCESGW